MNLVERLRLEVAPGNFRIEIPNEQVRMVIARGLYAMRDRYEQDCYPYRWTSTKPKTNELLDALKEVAEAIRTGSSMNLSRFEFRQLARLRQLVVTAMRHQVDFGARYFDTTYTEEELRAAADGVVERFNTASQWDEIRYLLHPSEWRE